MVDNLADIGVLIEFEVGCEAAIEFAIVYTMCYLWFDTGWNKFMVLVDV